MSNSSQIDVSFSRIQCYRQCPWKYHLVFNEGWRSGPAGPMAFGTTLHRALAVFLSPENKDVSLERLLEIYDESWVNEGFSGVQETLDVYNRGRDLLENFYRIQSQLPSKVVAAEKDFCLDVDGYSFRGTVDRIDQEPDGSYSVIEYKTNAQQWTPERIQKDLQMTLYEMGVSAGLKLTPLRLKYFFLSNGTWAETTRTAEQREEALNLIRQVGKSIQEHRFEPNLASCGPCEFGPRCRYFQK